MLDNHIIKIVVCSLIAVNYEGKRGVGVVSNKLDDRGQRAYALGRKLDIDALTIAVVEDEGAVEGQGGQNDVVDSRGDEEVFVGTYHSDFFPIGVEIVFLDAEEVVVVGQDQELVASQAVGGGRIDETALAEHLDGSTGEGAFELVGHDAAYHHTLQIADKAVQLHLARTVGEPEAPVGGEVEGEVDVVAAAVDGAGQGLDDIVVEDDIVHLSSFAEADGVELVALRAVDSVGGKDQIVVVEDRVYLIALGVDDVAQIDGFGPFLAIPDCAPQVVASEADFAFGGEDYHVAVGRESGVADVFEPSPDGDLDIAFAAFFLMDKE